MNKKEQIVEILKALLTETQGKLQFRREHLEVAIMTCRGSDKRTFKNWWDYLWKLGYFHQPEPFLFQLRLDKIAGLELNVQQELPPEQKRLS